MKKKGLIISTIVMMLVVVVALSTATYAWFAVSADAKISTLTVQTAASDGLQIAAMYDTEGGALQSGTMTLPPATKLWTGTEKAFGAELAFESALSTAYGVTGTGQRSTMYTAASRSATSYVSTAVEGTWWADNTSGEEVADQVASLAGIRFFQNSTATTPAAGANFLDGYWAGAADQAIASLVDKGLYVRTQGRNTVEVTAGNAAGFPSADAAKFVFYSDPAGTVPANTTPFANGVWSPSGTDTILADITTSGLTIYAYVPTAIEMATNTYMNYYTTVVSGEYPIKTDTVFYTDEAMTTVATGSLFTEGKYTGTDLQVTEPYSAVDGGIFGLFAERTTLEEVENLWTYEANNSALTTGLAPRYLIPAIANNEYFQLNFALKTQRGMVGNVDKLGVADIFIKKLAITASGGMAAAARIALIDYGTTNGTVDVSGNRFNGDGTLLKYFVPFNMSEYSGAAWANGVAEENIYNVAPASKWFQGAGFAYKYATNAPLAVNPDSSFDLNQQVVNASSAWQTATFYDIDKNTVWANKGLYEATTAASLGAGGEHATNNVLKMNSIGTFTAANTYKYYQLVIWFEGTDAQCISTYAGTGVTVDLAFDFYQQWK